jgi:arabinofuranosyltransferase
VSSPTPDTRLTEGPTTQRADAVTNVWRRAPRSYRRIWQLALLLGALQVAYAAGFIYRSSVVVEGRRYFCLFDDAMISMRYAANWAAGHGLVWNPGERVEGYTNLAWILLLGLAHLLPLSPSNMCLLVQVLGIPILWLCLVATVLLARACRLLPVAAACALVLVATYYNLTYFTLYGMETGMLTVLVTLALAESVQVVRQRTGRVTPFLWLALSMLVRPDILLLVGWLFLYQLLAVHYARKRLIAGVLIVAAVVAGQLVWRHAYYGEWLPNTYYLKATGWPLLSRLHTGLWQTLRTAVALGLPLLIALVALTRPKRWHGLLLGAFALGVGYQIYIGGDAWPLDRFVIPAAIGLLVLTGMGIHLIVAALVRRKTRWPGAVGRVALTLVCLAAINATNWDHFLLIAPPQTSRFNREYIRYLLAVRRLADPDAVMAVSAAGAVPYFSGLRCVDLLGKCDPHVARLPANPLIHWAGHNKSDFAYSLKTYKPDLVIQIMPLGESAFVEHYRPVAVQVDDVELVVALRNGSFKVRGGRALTWPEAEHLFGQLNPVTLRRPANPFAQGSGG